MVLKCVKRMISGCSPYFTEEWISKNELNFRRVDLNEISDDILYQLCFLKEQIIKNIWGISFLGDVYIHKIIYSYSKCFSEVLLGGIVYKMETQDRRRPCFPITIYCTFKYSKNGDLLCHQRIKHWTIQKILWSIIKICSVLLDN